MNIEILASDDAVVPVEGEAITTNPFAAVPEALRGSLIDQGFENLTAVQKAVIESEVEGRDLQISSQTGSGKTVALGFVITPALEAPEKSRGPVALIIVPTRELATQVCKELSWLMSDLRGVKVASVVGGTPVYKDKQLLKTRPRLLVGTPGRLLDHVKTGALDLSCVKELVLDEADQMLDMGFREELEGILDATPENRRTHLVSATFPRGIQQLAAQYQNDAVTIQGTQLGAANQDIEHRGHLVHNNNRYDTLVNLLLLAGDERTLVFVERRADAVIVAEKLEADGFSAMPLSGELAQNQRDRTMDAFRSGRAMVLVATDVAARGLDVPDVSTVIHTAPCIDGQVYTHRSGRTGRAGRSGQSILLSPPGRRYKVNRILKEAKVELTWLPVPTAKEVQKKISKRARVTLQNELTTALEQGSTDHHLTHAEELLAEHDGKELVAALLARLEPKSSAKAKDIQTAKGSEKFRDKPSGRDFKERSSRYEDRGPRDFKERSSRYEDRAPRDFKERSPHNDHTGKKFGSGRDGAPGGGVRFFINCGKNHGATPGRLLAILCRRGEVEGDTIGSIAIHPNGSTFDVRSDVADRFEIKSSRRDSRDPQMMIRPDRGPAHTSESDSSSRSKPSYGGGKPAHGGKGKGRPNHSPKNGRPQPHDGEGRFSKGKKKFSGNGGKSFAPGGKFGNSAKGKKNFSGGKKKSHVSAAGKRK